MIDRLKRDAIVAGVAAVTICGLSAVELSGSASAQSAASSSSADLVQLRADVDELIAIEEIKQLKARYFRCLDTKDWECWRTSVFTSDFRFGNSEDRGPDALINIITRNGIVDRVKTAHQGHMPEIEILSPTTARGIWSANYIHVYPLGQPYPTTGEEGAALGGANETWTFYIETYEKVDGQWLIKSEDLSSRQLLYTDYGSMTVPQTNAPPIDNR